MMMKDGGAASKFRGENIVFNVNGVAGLTSGIMHSAVV
jgi:hypothetical protein